MQSQITRKRLLKLKKFTLSKHKKIKNPVNKPVPFFCTLSFEKELQEKKKEKNSLK